MDKLFLVGVYYSGDSLKEIAWGFVGVFETHVLALQACKTPDYFITPVNLNEDVDLICDNDIEYFPDIEYPLVDCDDM